MDVYEKKFAELQKYIPFLEAMIERLKKVKDRSREPQLQKMQSLHGILSKSNGKKLSLEKLDRCEEFLMKLSRVDKSHSSLQSNKSSEETKQNITENLEKKASVSVDAGKDSAMHRSRKNKIETPASPSPPASPDQTSGPTVHAKPIIIPTERNDGYTGTSLDDRPASPDECELVAYVGIRPPVVIPTEPFNETLKCNPLRKTDPDTASQKVPRWNFSIPSNQQPIPPKSNLWSSTPSSISSIGSSSASSKASEESRHRGLRHIPTVPTPSKGASLIRKPVLVLDKKNSGASTSEVDSPKSKWDSPVPEAPIQTSPKSKELPPLPKLSATRLLVSPPKVLTVPPLTTEDLAELLSDDSESISGKKSDASRERSKKSGNDRSSEDGRRPEKDSDGKPIRNNTNPQDDVDNDRRWEEEYKQIVKMPSRKIITSPSSATSAKLNSELRFPPAPPPVPTSERPTDPRKRPPSPITKEREPPVPEPRYADNYEKHPRQPPRDLHNHNSIPDRNQINSAFPRMQDGDQNLHNDDRNPAHFQRRPYGPAGGMHDQSGDPRRENPEYYNRMMHQQEQNVRAPVHHSPGRNPDCNQPPWGPNSNYPQGPQGPNNQYQQQQQQQQRPDMWTMKAGGGNMPMDPHMMPDQSYMRQGPYPNQPNNCRGPMMSPQDMNHGCMDPGFRDDVPNQSMIPPLMPQMGPPSHPAGMPNMMPNQGYQMGGQYHGFPQENRPNIQQQQQQQQFERPQEFPHQRQSWDQPVNRPPDNGPYPRHQQQQQQQQQPPGQWNRQNRGPPGSGPPAGFSGPGGPVNRERPYNNERGRDQPPRPPLPSGFNRDPRTRAEPPIQQQQSPTGQTNPRRDPPSSQNVNSSNVPNIARRDPRFGKDTQAPPSKAKETTQSTDRNPRRSFDKKKSSSVIDSRKSNDKNRSQINKNDNKGRRESENEKIADKSVSKDPKSTEVMQSPLQSLYGVVDTGKTGKGYGLQKFKIPKIKRPEPAPSPPRIIDIVEDDWDLPDEGSTRLDSVNDDRPIDIDVAPQINRKESDEKKSEVTSTTEESTEGSRGSKEIVAPIINETTNKETTVQSSIELEAIDTSSIAADANPLKVKDALENMLEAAFREKLTKMLQSKKMKEQFKKLINSESSSNSDNENEETDSKRTASKKKRRVIVSSESSDEETLADRLAMVETDTPEIKNTAGKTRLNKTKKNKGVNEELLSSAINESSNDTSRDTREAPSKKGKPFRRKKREPRVKAAKDLETDQPLDDEATSETQTNEVATEEAAADSKEQPAKLKTRRRNSLEMLQEDVRDSFICDAVITATGFRSCRLQKDDQTQLNSSIENLTASNSKKKESSLDRGGSKADSDGERTTRETRQAANTRSRGGRTRNRKGPRTRGKPRQTSKEIISSDSETEDSSKIDTTLPNDSTMETSKISEDSSKADVTGDTNNKDDSEETHFLRRSERVGLRGSLMKEPRAVTPKIDSSKIMFDSSSDESFGIDESELMAAVDISLHPEPQNTSSTVSKTAPKSAVTTNKRKTRRKRAIAGPTIGDKIDGVASGDEAESIASDMSRASSLTRGKKTGAITGKPDGNEELLTDIITGLTDPKDPGEVENDVEASSRPSLTSTPSIEAKTNTRKKKKKSGWKMGVLKKKKRKPRSGPNTIANEVETEEFIIPEPELESSFEIPESKIEPTEFSNVSETANPEVEPKEEILSDSALPKSAENIGDVENPLIEQKNEPISPIKNPTMSGVLGDDFDIDIDENDDKKPLDDSLDDKFEVELNNEGIPNVGVRKLMSYIWTTRKERYRCMLCPWGGKNIVHHYTLSHPGREMMISRLSIPESKRAIVQAMTENYAGRIPKSVKKDIRKFTCRFCSYTTEGSSSTAIEAFYEHCTTHTGEYRFQCSSCPYFTVARSSMKTHYYRKACRNKYPGNLNIAICEDSVPDEDFLYGYICTKCNFIQLKESNVEKHVKSIHGKCSKVDIVKVDMSSFKEKDLYGPGTSGDNESELKIEEDPLADTEHNVSETIESNAAETTVNETLDIVDEALKDEKESNKSSPEKSTTQEIVTETPIAAGNLSAFVCPPELENKEDEIQHERRKKMQEVVDNIGISNKSSEKRDLSIIDKLKDKMTENIEDSINAAEAPQETETAQSTEESTTSSAGMPILVLDSVTSLAVNESTVNESQSAESSADKDNRETDETPVKEEPVDFVEASEIVNETENKSDKKPVDPLTNLEGSQKDDSSDDSDHDDNALDKPPPSYESDSSDQSDAEAAADVNSLLEETFNINTTTNAPMMTTIQRLAAKLQSEKVLPAATGEKTGETLEDQETIENDTSDDAIPKAPNAIPISSIQRFLGRRNAMLQEVAKEVSETIEDVKPNLLNSSPPKKFIRLRRLSGDKLSIPVPSPDQTIDSPTEISQPPSVENTESDPLREVVETAPESETKNVVDDEEKEACSFLRIENVVSLAPGAENNPNEPMINDIRKAVANSPKTQAGISLLKKSSPLILKRPIAIPVVIRPAPPPIPVAATPPPLAPQLPAQNVKLVKVVKGRTLLKQKDSTHRNFGSELKNPDNYTAMIQPEKLRCFYKCMARACSFATDNIQEFEAHYRQHKDNVDRSNMMLLTSYDFQRCAYCTETLTTWHAMSEHLRDKHIYCQYQCSYCFYRALAQSYVEIHQNNVHPNLQPSVLLGIHENPPIEVIDRREHVIPFVCHHECGKSFYVPGAFLAHLRTKHGNSLSIFKCHMCPAPLFKAEQLIAHYKLHGIYKYQCLYCIFGSEQSIDVHVHLSASHYNRPPHILERTLQPRPVRDKDVIQQLVVLNVDESYKCTELTLSSGQNASDIPKNKHWLQVDRNTNEGSALGVVTVPMGSIGMSRLFPYEKLDSTEAPKIAEPIASISNPTTPIITKYRKISPKKSPENILIVDESGSIRKISKISNSFVVEPVNKDSAKDNKSKSDTSGETHSNDEFRNFNILDDPKFLTTGKSKTAGVSILAKSTVKDNPKDTNDDSDIEILEHIEVPKSKAMISKTKSPAKIIPAEEKDSSKEEKTSETSGVAEPVIDCSSNENSLDLNLSTNSNIEETIEEPFERPLTLEQIQNTGFTGRNLYKCGYDSCEFGAENASQLRNHIKECTFATRDEMKNLNCVHCNKRFVKIGFLLEHFKLHGLKRFGCSMCKDRWTQPYQAMSHMKTKHRQTYSKLIPADPKNPCAEGLFVVEPIPSTGERSRSKKRGRAKSTDSDKIIDVQRLSYGPTEIHSLPRQPIYNQEVQCAVCPYKTKVRTNIIRHLQLHAKDETVPESGPVNPVPCLDKNERMFDKMVNLASSSHQNGRMGGTKPKETNIDSDAELLPKYVPENKRYVCGVNECNYLSIDEGMLRTHVKALHPDEPYYRCPHCPAQLPGHEAQNIAIDKMGIHLKMHDTKLYKCSHCNNHHYHRHVVERHLSDKHTEANPFVKVIREIDIAEAAQQQLSQEYDEKSSDTEGNYWKCNICDFKCNYKADMSTHALSVHEEKAQFKCTVCRYKTNNKIVLEQHTYTKHADDPTADYTMVYQKLKGSGPKRPAAESVEASGVLDEPFDTTPLWRRDMPRVRHIRGILFEDESETPTKSGKRKSDVDISSKSGKAKMAKTTSDSSTYERDNESVASTIFSETSINTDDSFGDVDGMRQEKLDTSRLIRKFGPYGAPLAHFWQCTICQCFKTKYKHDMRDHLYRDLKYFRYRCVLCGYSGVSKTATLKHFTRNHHNRHPTGEEQERLPVDQDIETWVGILLKSQLAQMRGMSVDVDGNVISDAKPKKANASTARRSTDEASSKLRISNISQSSLKNTSLLPQTVDLAQTISDMKPKKEESDENIGFQDFDEEYSNDALVIDSKDPLVIDSKDDGLERVPPENVAIGDDFDQAIVDTERAITCKHCGMHFERFRGFKLHVQIRHLRRLNYLCPYCDTSSNSENLMRRHLRLKHGNLPEQVNQNPVQNLPELTSEFWEREYGLVTPGRQRKRKRTAIDDTPQDQSTEKASGGFHVCGTCGFRAINHFGLGVHMRVHAAVKSYKCAYCTFAATDKTELWQHSEKNHSHLDWRVGNGDQESSESMKNEESDRAVDEYAEYVAAEAASSRNTFDTKPDTMYVCFYCNFSRKTIDALKDHWTIAHKNSTKAPGNATGMPFRYKETVENIDKKWLRCGYCPKRGLAATIRLHSKKKHPSKAVKFVEIPVVTETWICQWCGESVDSEAKKKVHQNMFHSHLPPTFSRSTPGASSTVTSSSESEAATCPKCQFKTSSITAMQKHLVKHVDSVRCKRCDKTFPDVAVAIIHNTQAHPGEVSAIEGFTANVEKLMLRVNWRTVDNSNKTVSETVPRAALDSWRNAGVAKKSTTKSTVVRSVARKSTNPLPRYPPGTRFDIDDNTNDIDRNISYYGRPRIPINLNNISTYITLGGGRQMKVSCTTLAQLFDIEPRVIVNDVKHDFTVSTKSFNKT